MRSAAEAAVPHGNRRSAGRPRSAVRSPRPASRFATPITTPDPTTPADVTPIRRQRDRPATSEPTDAAGERRRCSRISRSISTDRNNCDDCSHDAVAKHRYATPAGRTTHLQTAKTAGAVRRQTTKEVQGCTITHLAQDPQPCAHCRSSPCSRRAVVAACASPRLAAALRGKTSNRPRWSARSAALSEKLELTTNTSRILTLDKNIPRVQVNNPELLAVTPLSANQVQISAKKAGVTQVNLWDEDGNIHTVDVLIYGDARELAGRAANAVPAFVDQRLSLQRKPGAERLRRSAGPRQPDHAAGRGLRAEGDQQHQRRRRAAGSAQGQSDGNLAHEAAPAGRRLGRPRRQRQLLRSSSVSGLLQHGSTSAWRHSRRRPNSGGQTFAVRHRRRQRARSSASSTRCSKTTSPRFWPSRTSWPSAAGRPSSTSAVNSRSSCRKAWARASIEFKPFGTQVDFLPIVLGNGNIRLEVRPRISEIDDFAQRRHLNGIVIPALDRAPSRYGRRNEGRPDVRPRRLGAGTDRSAEARLAVSVRHADHRRAVPQDAKRSRTRSNC